MNQTLCSTMLKCISNDEFCNQYKLFIGLPWWLSGEESTCKAEDTGDRSSAPRSRRATPVFSPEESHGQNSINSPWNHKESDTTERLSTAQHPLQYS